jgi:ribosomal-protein-alanine N-acetyltransferase
MKLFETDNLLVREFTTADAESFFLINSNDQVMRFIRPVKTREECDVFLAENIRLYREKPGTGRWAVVDTINDSIIGMFSILQIEQNDDRLHIGYAFLPAYWGKGYATVLLRAGTTHFIEQHPHKILYAITRKENVASEKVLLKCGFSMAGIYGEHENLWKIEG